MERECFELRAQGSGLRAQGSGLGAQGLGCRLDSRVPPAWSAKYSRSRKMGTRSGQRSSVAGCARISINCSSDLGQVSGCSNRTCFCAVFPLAVCFDGPIADVFLCASGLLWRFGCGLRVSDAEKATIDSTRSRFAESSFPAPFSPVLGELKPCGQMSLVTPSTSLGGEPDGSRDSTAPASERLSVGACVCCIFAQSWGAKMRSRGLCAAALASFTLCGVRSAASCSDSALRNKADVRAALSCTWGCRDSRPCGWRRARLLRPSSSLPTQSWADDGIMSRSVGEPGSLFNCGHRVDGPEVAAGLRTMVEIELGEGCGAAIGAPDTSLGSVRRLDHAFQIPQGLEPVRRRLRGGPFANRQV